MDESTFARFAGKIRVDDLTSCWLWTAALGRDGYGRIGAGGRRGKSLLAHRASYELFVAPIPAGLEIDHLCRNRACVNPDHLLATTRRDNLIRGDGAEIQLRRTHCPKGHPYDEANTISRYGRRFCRTCHNEGNNGGKKHPS